MKLWYLSCLLVLIYSIGVLIDERNDSVYYLENDKEQETNSTYYAVCFKLLDLFENETKIQPNQLINGFLNSINKTKNTYNILWIKNELNILKIKLKYSKYFVFRKLLCFKIYNRINLFALKFLLIDVIHYAINRLTNEFHQMQFYYSSINNLIVKNSNCIRSKETKFDCYHNCIKNKNQRLSKYYYDYDELMDNKSDYIYLKYDKMNQTIIDNENDCILSKCNHHFDCVLSLITPNYRLEVINKTNYYQEYPVINRLNYLIQFICLICLIFNISIYQLIYKSINRSIDYMKKYSTKLKEIHKFYFKILILIISLILYLILIYRLINQYFIDLNYPIKKETIINQFNFKEQHLIICINFGLITKSVFFLNKTLQQFEDDLSSFELNKNIIQIYLDYHNQKIEINWLLMDDVYFYHFFRCWRIKVFLNEPKFQTLLTKPRLHIKSEKISFIIYLIPINQNFNDNSFRLDDNFSFVRREIKRSRLNGQCNEYSKLKIDKFCLNRIECLDQCLIREYFRYTNSSYFGKVINKKHFDNYEWNRLIFWRTNYASNFSFNKAREECEKKYELPDCFEITYEMDVQIKTTRESYRETQIDLDYNIIRLVEDEPSKYDLLINILNIEMVLFGLNIFKILWFILIRIKFNKLIIYTICLIGFNYNLITILNDVLNENLIYTQLFRVEEFYRMHDMIFCLKFNQTLIDNNYKLTTNYLNNLSDNITIDKLFKKIIYLNKSNQWIEIDFNQLNRTNLDYLADDQFKIDVFFLSNKKCIKLKIKIEYLREQFNFRDNNQVLKILFNPEFIYSDNKQIYFFSKDSDKLEFSKLSLIKFSKVNFKSNRKYTYLISQNLFEINLNDKFYFIKNPLSILNDDNNINDANKYLTKLINNFRNKYNLNTLNLPINLDNLEIDDQLFNQFYLQIQNQTDQTLRSNLNYQRQFVINYLSSKTLIDNQKSINYDFIFELLFFRKGILITNKDNLVKLFLTFLNILSLYLDLGILDLYVYVYKIENIFNFIYYLLIDIYLNFNFNHNLNNS